MPRKEIPLHSLSLSLDDVSKIFERLLRYVREQGDIEVSRFIKPEGKTDEEFQREKDEVRERAFRITVTITGHDRASLFGDDLSVFSSPNRPDRIASVYMTNIVAYQAEAGRSPLNAFELILDFSKPPLLDSNNVVSQPTPNNSRLKVEGDRDAWVAAVTDAVLGVLQNRRTRRSWIHRAFVYDFGVLVLGLPLGIYFGWKLSPFISEHLGSVHSFLSAAAYLYIVLLTSWGYRILFGYTKWAFPTIELQDNKDKSSGHRASWWVIILGIVAGLASDAATTIWSAA